MATFHERLAIIVEANAGKAIAEFHKVGAAAKQAGAGTEGGAKGLARFGIAGQTAGNLLKVGIAAGVAAAGTAIAKFAIDGVNAFVEVTGEVRKFQRVSGATAEDASKLVAAFHVLGVDADAAGTAVFKMAVKIGSADKAFADTGVVVARTATGTVDLVETILNLGDAYKAIPDASKRADLLGATFGTRAAQAFLPLLGRTREELEGIFAAAERHGLIFNQEQLDKAREYGIATRELSESFKGLQVEAGERLVPVLTDLAIAITKVIDATHQGIGKDFVDFLGHMPGLLQLVAGGAHLLAGDEGDVAREAARATAAIEEQATEADKLKKTIFSASDAQRAYETAGRSVESANRSQAKAQKEYDKLLKEGAVDEQKVVDARRSLADATRSLGHAQREQTKAQDEYNDALAAYNILGTDTAADTLADKRDNLADANDNVASATEANTKAAEDLAKAQAGDPEYQTKLADAKQAVADATQAASDATYSYGKASVENVAKHDAETGAIAGKADQVARLRGELETMLKLSPEQFSFLSPIIAGLNAALAPGGAATPIPTAVNPLAGGGLLPGVSLLNPGGVGPAGVSSSKNPWDIGAGVNQVSPGATTTNNVTINATGSETDARLIAKEVMWNLN